MREQRGPDISSIFRGREFRSPPFLALVVAGIFDTRRQPTRQSLFCEDIDELGRRGHAQEPGASAAFGTEEAITLTITQSLQSLRAIVSELERLTLRARLPELPAGELSELDAMAHELLQAFRDHAALRLEGGCRPFQGEVAKLTIPDSESGPTELFFPSNKATPLRLEPLSFSTPEELLRTERLLDAVRSQLDFYSDEAKQLTRSIAYHAVQAEVASSNRAASRSSPEDIAEW